MRGVIALDIDGTITVPGQAIPSEVIQYFSYLTRTSWVLVFVTGRTAQWSQQLFSKLPFSYYLIVQNGAITLSMPTKQIIEKKYLHKEVLEPLQEICEDEPTDFVIYSGCENQDIVYYRPHYFSKELLEYVRRRAVSFNEHWKEISSFDLLDNDQFPSVKCFGLHPSAQKIAHKMEEKLNLHVPLIRDPFNSEFFVAQAIHPQASKGKALHSLAQKISPEGIIIAAGDDYNDCSMLSVAQIKIVMATAPQEMLKAADIIAPPASEKGIIAGIKQALEKQFPIK